MEHFTTKEQDEIINQFLDVIKVNDYLRESREKRERCKCKDCRKHERYCVLNELPIPENIIKNIYGFAYRCVTCEKAKRIEEVLDEQLETNVLQFCNVDNLLLSLERLFPSYETAKMHIKNISESRYKKFVRLYKERMECNDNKEIREFIEYTLKLNFDTTVRDFNKVIREYFNKPNFDILN